VRIRFENIRYLQLPSIAGGRSSIRNLRTCHAVVIETHLMWVIKLVTIKIIQHNRQEFSSYITRQLANPKLNHITLKPARSCAIVVRSRLWMMIKYPLVVQMIILEASGLSLVRIKPFVWKTRLYTNPLSV
jgi:hypothetical protein